MRCSALAEQPAEWKCIRTARSKQWSASPRRAQCSTRLRSNAQPRATTRSRLRVRAGSPSAGANRSFGALRFSSRRVSSDSRRKRCCAARVRPSKRSAGERSPAIACRCRWPRSATRPRSRCATWQLVRQSQRATAADALRAGRKSTQHPRTQSAVIDSVHSSRETPVSQSSTGTA